MFKIINIRKKILLLIILMLAIVSNIKAERSAGAKYLLREVPARAAALSAGVADRAGGTDILSWNPAGLTNMDKLSIAFTHLVSFADTNCEQIEIAYPGLFKGNIGLRVFYETTATFDKINDQAKKNGVIDYHSMFIELFYAKEIIKNLSAGATIKFLEGKLEKYDAQGLAGDIGLNYQTPWQPLALGASVRNLGALSAYYKEADPLPLQMLVGLSLTHVFLKKHEVGLLLDATKPLAGDDELVLASGLEYSFNNFGFIRFGYRFAEEEDNLSVGAGIKYSKIGLDYAYQPHESLGENHRLTLSY